MVRPLQWESVSSLQEFDRILDTSRYTPAVILKHDPDSLLSLQVKQRLEKEWDLSFEELAAYLINPNVQREVADEMLIQAGVSPHCPQLFLYADGVTMYDESDELISFRKIKIALKIINRTFQWMETRA